MQPVPQVVGGVLRVLLGQRLQGLDQLAQELILSLGLQRLEGVHVFVQVILCEYNRQQSERYSPQLFCSTSNMENYTHTEQQLESCGAQICYSLKPQPRW